MQEKKSIVKLVRRGYIEQYVVTTIDNSQYKDQNPRPTEFFYDCKWEIPVHVNFDRVDVYSSIDSGNTIQLIANNLQRKEKCNEAH